MNSNWIRLVIGVGLIAISFLSLAQSRTGPPMPPVPPLPGRVIAVVTNGEDVIEVRKASSSVTKADMPAPLPVSDSAPHHYYGVVEFKSTKDGLEPANEVIHFGLYHDDDAFRRSHGVGNTKFNRKYKAVIKYPSELPLDILCIWQRRDGPTP